MSETDEYQNRLTHFGQSVVAANVAALARDLEGDRYHLDTAYRLLAALMQEEETGRRLTAPGETP